MIAIAPSLLAADFTRLGEEVRSLENSGASMLHLDIMDGNFVPNISFGPDVVRQLRPVSSLFFDVHLMISNAERYIDRFLEAGADGITVHIEAVTHPEEVLKSIRAKGAKAAVSIKPATPSEVLKPLLPWLDMILVMSVEPGFGGQSFLPESVEKIKAVKAIVQESGCDILIQVDGGVNIHNIAQVSMAGADIAVAGTAVFGQKDRKEAIQSLQKITSEDSGS